MVEFRDYQKDIIERGVGVLEKHRMLYLAMEVRTGKTLTSLGIANRLAGGTKVLFITKKKAISSIVSDYELLSPDYLLTVINYESLHKVPQKGWHTIIVDEAHSLGAFPKASTRAKLVRQLMIVNNPYAIFLSGTPTPESYSQMYHQVYGVPSNPFSVYKNFYKFASEYVNVTQKKINGFNINDYSDGRPEIIEAMDPYTISYTQSQAGFESTIEEEVLYVDMQENTYAMCKNLKRNLVIEGASEVILADTGAKLMSKLHQMYSGTVKFESGNSMVLDYSKAEFIRWKFDTERLGIFYKFKEEYNALKKVFGSDICDNLEDFDSGKCKHIALQIVSGREGISLRNADFIVFYNIDFSATSYWQARDRMTTKDRKHNKIYWVFAKNGIEKRIYKAVSNKKDYTLSHFRSDLISL
jgi:hypothetical protein